jgi:hypothetical protein
VILVACLSSISVGQSSVQPGLQFSDYNLLLVSHQKGIEGVMVGIDRQRQIVFVPISSTGKAVNEDGVLPVRYGDLLQLLRQLGDENSRLKAENDHLWKVAEGHPGATAPTTVVVQQQPAPQAPQPDPEAERRQARLMLLQSLLAPRSATVNVNVRDCTHYPALCAGR